MQVTLTPAVELAIRTLGEDDRRRIAAWLDNLANYENDSHVREISSVLPGDENILVLRTSSDIRIFFTIRGQEIVVLDVARKDSIDRLRNTAVQRSA